MRLRFNEAKATQAAGRLLQLLGANMSYLKLIKLLYILDREALLRWGRPVTTDRYVSMDRGPVVSKIYDLIIDELPSSERSIWREHISEPQHYFVQLLKEAGADELSRIEEDLIEEVARTHGAKTPWELVAYSHSFPEWQDPKGSAIPIEYRDILRAGRKTETEIAAIEAELESIAATEALVAPG
jgi:uncharacterized phage-associated protein